MVNPLKKGDLIPMIRPSDLMSPCKHTEWGVLSVAIFCYAFPCELRGTAWAVGSYSIS